MKRLIVSIMAVLYIFNLTAANLSGNLNNLFTSQKFYSKGDVIRILIYETAQASQSNETGLIKNEDIGGGISLTGVTSYEAGLKYNNQHNGKGTAKQSGVLQAEITAIITDVKENGMLVIKGYKELQMNGNTQKISIEGEVNPLDISADNTVLSTKLANLRIDYTGEGVLGNKAKVGIISQIFEWIGLF